MQKQDPAYRACSFFIMNTTLTIKAAARNELSIIRGLACTIWPATFKDILSREQIAYMLDKTYALKVLEQQLMQQQHFIIAWRNDTPVGFAAYEQHCPVAGNCKLHKIYILPMIQKTGVGRSLMDFVKQSAIANKQATLSLNVNRYNRAIGFYEKYGFRIIKEEDIDIGSGYFMNDYVMSLPLK